MRPPNADFPRRPLPRVAAAALVALAPKCLLCLAGHLGLGAAALGLGGPELCGDTPGLAPSWKWLLSALVAAGALILVAHRAKRDNNSRNPNQPSLPSS